MKIIAIVCQKGGVGKSTTALNMGAGLAFAGKKVLFVDLDAQANLTETLGADSRNETVLEVLTGECALASCLRRLPLGDVLPAGPGLAGADMLITGARKEYRLKDALTPLAGNYDYAVIDTPPALGIFTINALTAASDVIIPVQADSYSLHAIGQLSRTIAAVRAHSNPGLAISGILLTRHNSRSVLSRDMSDMIEETAATLHTRVFATSVREAVAVKESQACGKDIFSYAPKSGAAADYNDLIAEYRAQEENHGQEKF